MNEGRRSDDDAPPDAMDEYCDACHRCDGCGRALKEHELRWGVCDTCDAKEDRD